MDILSLLLPAHSHFTLSRKYFMFPFFPPLFLQSFQVLFCAFSFFPPFMLFSFSERHIHHIFVSFFSTAAKHPCPPTRPFRCRNDHVCLRSDQVCNKVDDCGDKSDEEECGEPGVHRYYLHSRQKSASLKFSASFRRFIFWRSSTNLQDRENKWRRKCFFFFLRENYKKENSIQLTEGCKVFMHLS